MDVINAAAYILLMLPQGALVESRVVDRGHPGFLLHPAIRPDETTFIFDAQKPSKLIVYFGFSDPSSCRYCTLLYRNNRLYHF